MSHKTLVLSSPWKPLSYASKLFAIYLSVTNLFFNAGFSEYTGVAGGPLILPCNTTNGASWTGDVTMVLFYKGVNGKPLFTIDRRNDQRNITLPISSTATHHSHPRRAKPTAAASGPRSSLISSNSFYYDQALNTPVYFIESLREADESEYRCRIDYKKYRTRNYVIKLNVIGECAF